MKRQLFCFCAVLVVALSLGAFSAQSSQNTTVSGQAAPPDANQKIVPSAAAAESGNPNDVAIAVDAEYVYVIQNGMLYKYPKANVGAAGSTLPPSAATGAGPACPAMGQGMSYIPGPSSTLTITSSVPCIPVTPPGAGPGDPCAPPCPPPVSCCPSSIVSCTPPTQCPCPKIQPGEEACARPECPSNCVITTSTVPAGPGAGECTLAPIASVSECARQALDCLNQLCDVEADKAYLQSMMQLNLQVLTISHAAATRLGTTNLQDFAINSVADSREIVAKAQKWLRTKYCLEVQACAPSLGTVGFDICSVPAASKAFDEEYKTQLVQHYMDEIALSQAELQRGLDCQVKEFAAETIKNNQVRIARISRCTLCGP